MRFEHDGDWYEMPEPPGYHRWYPGMKPSIGGEITVTEYEEDGGILCQQKYWMPVFRYEVENCIDELAYHFSAGWYPAFELGWELDK